MPIARSGPVEKNEEGCKNWRIDSDISEVCLSKEAEKWLIMLRDVPWLVTSPRAAVA